MEHSLLETAQKLLRSGRIVEQCLERVLRKSDRLGPHVTQVLADALTKLVQDIAGLPLALGHYVSDAHAMRCLVVVLHEVLKSVRPETLQTREQESRAQARVRDLCRRHGLPAACAAFYGVLVSEISFVMRRLSEALSSPLVRKPRNAAVLLRCIRHCFRDMSAALVCFSFNSLKLAVCMRALAQGCVSVKRRVKEAIHDTLRQVQEQARCLAAVNDVHAENIFTALELSKRRAPPAFFD